MSKQYKVLIMGASYGSLLGTKMLLAGHDVTLVCTPSTAALINDEGTRVRLPVRGRDSLVEVASKSLPGTLDARVPGDVSAGDYDLVVLAMQEPQYGADGVAQLLEQVALARVPCMAIMNMPPLPYLHRLPAVDAASLEACYTDVDVWQHFDPDLVTLASPDPQAFRPPEEGKNVLQVSLPTNFKVARFASDEHTAMLRDLEADIKAVRVDVDGEPVELPVKLRVHDSLYVPLAKWCMLITGNYRCIGEHEAQPICDAVGKDPVIAASCYQWVVDLCVKLGASPDDMVPFEKYANAAKGLSKPSSAARALFSGAENIERVDLLVQTIGQQLGMRLPELDKIVNYANNRLQQNRLDRKAS